MLTIGSTLTRLLLVAAALLSIAQFQMARVALINRAGLEQLERRLAFEQKRLEGEWRVLCAGKRGTLAAASVQGGTSDLVRLAHNKCAALEVVPNILVYALNNRVARPDARRTQGV